MAKIGFLQPFFVWGLRKWNGKFDKPVVVFFFFFCFCEMNNGFWWCKRVFYGVSFIYSTKFCNNRVEILKNSSGMVFNFFVFFNVTVQNEDILVGQSRHVGVSAIEMLLF